MATDPIKSIPEFYAGQSIFLTGATGFLLPGCSWNISLDASKKRTKC